MATKNGHPLAVSDVQLAQDVDIVAMLDSA
jgi:hypothetical protein